MICPEIRGKQHWTTLSDDAAFKVGVIGEGGGFIHVFDDFSLDLVLGYLDTISDFISYLDRRAEFILSGRLAMAAGEEALLGCYLRSVDDRGEHAFKLPGNADGYYLADDLWDGIDSNPERLAQIEADRISYAWDQLIERLSDAACGDSYSQDAAPFEVSEQALRIMASANRTKHRALSARYGATMEDGRGQRWLARMYRGTLDPEMYLFLSVTHPDGESPASYRQARRKLLEAYTTIARLHSDADYMIGLAREPLGVTPVSYDLCYLDCRGWSQEDEAHARRLQEETGLLVRVNQRKGTTWEYPLQYKESLRKGRARNSPCHCGSGRKYKKCCGRSKPNRTAN